MSELHSLGLRMFHGFHTISAWGLGCFAKHAASTETERTDALMQHAETKKKAFETSCGYAKPATPQSVSRR